MQLIWENSAGKSITIPQPDRYILQDWSGFANPVNTLKTEKGPDQIGTTVINQIYEQRNMDIQFAILRDTRQEVYEARRKIVDLFNPVREEGTITWIQEGGTEYCIDAYLENLDMPGGDGRGDTYQIVQTSFMAEDPRWYNLEPKEVVLTESNSVENAGDTRTPVEIVIEGPVVNPEITSNTTGKTIKINHELLAGEKITVDTTYGEKKLIYENEAGESRNAISLLDLDSELFFLEPGVNFLEVDTQESGQDFTVNLRFYERYIGV